MSDKVSVEQIKAAIDNQTRHLPSSNLKSKKRSKALFIVIGVVLFGGIIGFLSYYFSPYQCALRELKEIVAEEKGIGNLTDFHNYPLHVAANEGQTEIVKLLIEAGVDVNKADEDGNTPLHRAADSHFVTEKGEIPTIGFVLREGQTEAVKLLIKAGADVNKADTHGHTPLFAPVCYGHSEIVKLLIEAGANVNKASEEGWTPLLVSTVNEHLEVSKLLIAAGADVNKEYWQGTLLHWAAFNGKLEVVKLLIESGADVNKADKEGNTPLRCATKKGYTEIVELLIKAGARE